MTPQKHEESRSKTKVNMNGDE